MFNYKHNNTLSKVISKNPRKLNKTNFIESIPLKVLQFKILILSYPYSADTSTSV